MLLRSKSTLGETFRMSRQASGSMLKRTTSISSHKKSPGFSSERKDNRPISDKRWQYEQLVKVKTFVAMHLQEINHNNIKSGMSLDTFILLMSLLCQMIDKRFEVTKANYIDEIPTTLRLFNYPTNVQPSLMKSVNTSHSWPAVLAMISWLIDIVSKIMPKEKAATEDFSNIVEASIVEWAALSFRNQENSIDCDQVLQKLDAKLVQFFNIDEEKEAKLQQDVQYMKITELEYTEKNRKNCEEIQKYQQEIIDLKSKCSQYVESIEDFKKQAIDKKMLFTEKISKTEQELQNCRLIEENLKTIITNQPYSVADKQTIEKEINNLRDVVNLKEERSQHQRELIHKLDHELTDWNKKMQTDAYNYNNIIKRLELLDPDWNEGKEFYIRESGFIKIDTKDELHKVKASLKKAIGKFNKCTAASAKRLNTLEEKHNLVKVQVETCKNELEQLNRKQAELRLIHESKITKVTAEQQSALYSLDVLRKELLELKLRRPNIEELTQQVKLKNEEFDATTLIRKESQLKALEFFTNLDLQITENLNEYMEIMETTSASIASSLHKEANFDVFLHQSQQLMYLNFSAVPCGKDHKDVFTSYKQHKVPRNLKIRKSPHKIDKHIENKIENVCRKKRKREDIVISPTLPVVFDELGTQKEDNNSDKVTEDNIDTNVEYEVNTNKTFPGTTRDFTQKKNVKPLPISSIPKIVKTIIIDDNACNDKIKTDSSKHSSEDSDKNESESTTHDSKSDPIINNVANVKRKRKRVRRKVKVKCEATSPKPFVPPKVLNGSPHLHIRFDDNDDDKKEILEEEINPLSKNNIDYKTFCKEKMDMFPLMGAIQPKVDDILAFKIYKLSVNYTPEISDYIVAKVMNYCPDSLILTLDILQGIEEFEEPEGKFYLGQELEQKLNHTKEMQWLDVIQPRLLFP
ncbi:hypothetical protein FQA39_LY07790 [Lamprigera yunnana]|nr:hypothetical protein FQA39_LY07790 [Lamprigera yunnana]